MDLYNEITPTARNERAIIAKQIGEILKPIVIMGMAYFGHDRGNLVLTYAQLLGISAEEDLDDALLDYELDNNSKKLDNIITSLKKSPERYRNKLAEFEKQTKQYVEEQTRVRMVFKDTPERSKLLEELKIKGPALIAERKNDIATIEQALEKLQQLLPQGLRAATLSTMSTTAAIRPIISPAVNSTPEQSKGLPGNLVAANLSLRRK